MATSSSFSTDNQFIKYRIVVTENSTSIPNNSSNVTVVVQAWRTNTGYETYGSGTCYVKIDGIEYSSSITSSQRITYNSYTQLFSKTLNIAHNTSGAKSLNVTARISHSRFSSTEQGFTVALTNIPRYATVSQSLTARSETTATMKWSSDTTVDYIWYSTNNGSTWSGINVADGTGGTYVISGLTANTRYNIKTRVRRKDSQLTTDSTALAVTTYAYPYCKSGTNFTIGNTCTINLYNPLARTVSVVFVCADGETVTNSTSGTSYTGIHAASSQTKLYNSIPNSQSGSYSVRVVYSGNTSTKTNVGTYTVNKSDSKPSIGAGAYSDINSATVAITHNDQQIVRNLSKFKATATGLTARNSATIASCQVEVNGTTYNMSVSGSTAMTTGTGILIDSGYNVDAVFTVTDSRGLTATKKITVTVLDWFIPSAIITMNRHNNFYSETDITVDADYASVDGKNVIQITYTVTRVGSSTPTISGTLTDNVLTTFTADNNYAWKVAVTLTDSFGGTVTYNLRLSRGMPIIYFDRLKSSVGINCFPKEEMSLEVNGVNIMRSVMTRSLSANATDLMAGAYTILPMDLSISAGDKLTATSDGGIKIGANVSKILVSGRVYVSGGSTAGLRHIRITKNSNSPTSNVIGWSYLRLEASETNSIFITPTLGSVSENDVIYLFYYLSSGDTIGGNANGGRTSFTVETVE